MTKLQTYTTQEITVTFDGDKCIHARQCVLNLPDVFQANVPGPWIKPENAESEELAAIIRRCPSGALQFRKMQGSQEQPPRRNVISVLENGPLAIHADITIDGEKQASHRAVLCRCGQSQNKPYCDGSHHTAHFQATGEPKTADNIEVLPEHGTVNITPVTDGPLLCVGPVEIVKGSGQPVQRGNKFALCRCGQSQTKPFCDGSHKAAGFRAP